MIEVYTKDNCSYCSSAKALLRAKKLEFTEIRIGMDITKDEFLEVFPDALTVPQIIFDGEAIGGYAQLKQRV